ncbi:MAG: hypothetical protein IT379_25375 [Deltaproteobacteria bacterium]|nr:hypothetical protein [Deltaproteobacteria bacterium]
MPRRRTTWGVLLLLGAGGCMGSDEAGRTSSGYLVLDQEAREAGYHIDSIESSALPTAFEDGDEAVLVAPDGTRTTVRIAEDEVVRVGAGGAIERAVLGRSASRDAAEVEATEQAARALGEELGASVTAAADGVWRLEAPDLIAGSAGAAAPEGLDEVRWIAMTSETTAATPDVRRQAPIARAALPASTRAAIALDPAALIPPSARKIERREWAIDAMLPAPVACDDPIVGTWVSREHYDQYGDWYYYRVRIGRSGRDPSRLTGTMTSRSWNGDAQRSDPNSCDLFDWTVSMPIEGRLDADGSVRFGGTSYRVTDAACGSPSDYRTDQFTGELFTTGDGLKAFNNDGGRAINDPHTFRRISCR